MSQKTEEQYVQELCDAFAGLGATQLRSSAETRFGIFLGDNPVPLIATGFASEGHAKNSIYQNLPSWLYRWYLEHPDYGEDGGVQAGHTPMRAYYNLVNYWTEHRKFRHKAVDCLLARGILRIAPMARHRTT